MTPALSCPALNSLPPALRYIARSTTIGTVAVTTADTSVEARMGASRLTQTLNRLRGPTSYVRAMGAPVGRRYVTVTCACASDGFEKR